MVSKILKMKNYVVFHLFPMYIATDYVFCAVTGRK